MTATGWGAWQRRFAYDRWGNRTGVWDATSGGNQIQSVNLQMSGGAPTNRITTITNSGVPSTQTYDASGNLTNDGAHTYQYDGEGQVWEVLKRVIIDETLVEDFSESSRFVEDMGLS